MRRTLSIVLLLALLALFAPALVHGSEDEEGGDYGGGDDEYGGGMGEDGEYDGSGEEEEGGGEAPPPAGDVQELMSVADLDAFLDNEDASIVGAFTVKEMTDPEATLPEGWDEEEDGKFEAPTVENPALAEFKTIAGSVYGYRYAFSADPDVLAKLKSKAGGVYLFRSPKFLSAEHGDRPRERFPSDKLSESALSNWMKAKAQPLVGLYSSSTSTRYEDVPTLVIYSNLDFEQNAKGVNYVLKRARKAAAPLKGKVAVAVAKLSDMSYELTDFGLESNKPNLDILMGIKAKGKFYAPEAKAFSAAAIAEFAQAFLDGKVEEHVRPPPPPYEGGADDDGGAEPMDPDDDDGMPPGEDDHMD